MPVDTNNDGQTITVKFNDIGGEAHDIYPMADKKVGYFVWTSNAVTALFVTNASAVDMAVIMVLAGD